MKLLNLEINNFLSIGHIQTPLKESGLVLVTGSNGNGKSSFARNSICWVLYGVTANGIRGDKVINHRAGKKCNVTLDFLDANGEKYSISRGRKPNYLKIFHKDKDISQKTESQTQQLIEQILGKSFELFLHSDLFGQGRKKSFMNQTASEQRSIIEEILPLEKLNDWLTNATTTEGKISVILDQLNNIKSNIVGQISVLERTKSSNKKDFLNWEQKRSEAIKKLRNHIDQVDKVVKEKTSKIDQFKKEIDFLKSGLEPQDDNKIKHLEEKIHEETYKQKDINVLLNRAKERKSFFERTSICESCFRSISSDEKERFIKDISGEIEDLNEKELESKGKINALHLDLIDIKGKRHKANLIEKEISSRKDRIKDLEISIAKDDNREYLNVQLEDLTAETNPYKEQLDSTISFLKEEEKELKNLHVQISEKTKEKERVSFWKKAFGKDIPVLLFDQACPFVEQRANYYLSLLNNSQLKVGIKTLKELQSGSVKRDLVVSAESEAGKDFSLLSGGEQQLINFSVCLALSDLAETQSKSSFKFIILDEPFVNLDPRNCESVVSFITSYISKKKETILLISNEEGLKQSIPNQLTIVKEDGVSRLEN